MCFRPIWICPWGSLCFTYTSKNGMWLTWHGTGHNVIILIPSFTKPVLIKRMWSENVVSNHTSPYAQKPVSGPALKHFNPHHSFTCFTVNKARWRCNAVWGQNTSLCKRCKACYLLFLYPVQDAERVPHSKRDAEMYVVSPACICKCQSDWGPNKSRIHLSVD
jgi:hypothetical protein